MSCDAKPLDREPTCSYSDRVPMALPAAAPLAELFAPVPGSVFPFILDACDGSRPSFAGSSPTTVLIVDASGNSVLYDHRGSHVVSTQPHTAIADFIEGSHSTPRYQPPWLSEQTILPRTVGYLGYELAPFIEKRVSRAATDPLSMPLAVLATYPRVRVWQPGVASCGEVIFDDEKPAQIQALGELSGSNWNSTGREKYQQAFDRIKQSIGLGEIYQANLARVQTLPVTAPALEIMQRLRSVQPVPHGALFDYGGFQIISNSPETFLRVDGEHISVFPIKGTRAATGSNDRGNAQAQAELKSDAKEAAEHVMIVDLERNDLGRIAVVGSVAVRDFARLRSFATVHHLESEVAARLRPDVGVYEILRATFPCGSITGAPKIRAMDIIAEVEGVTRGVYTGALGCWNGGRQADLAVAIRTAVASAGRIHYWSGGGIVADSQADREWDETCVKAQAFLRALEEI
ncbi:MAG: anthranilate/para-aminobenzoate synthase component I [Hyphomicrobiaceae bacterium]|jgi:anthranilate/para-aminobenzoate synthase component I